VNDSTTGWSNRDTVSYYASNRCSLEDLYPSEQYFLKPEFLTDVHSVLDVGCAAGGFLNVFTSLTKDIQYTGIDVVKELIDIAKERYGGYGVFIHYSGKGVLPVNGKFDLVFSSGVMHLIENWKELFEEIVDHAKKFVLVDFRTTTEKSYCGKFIFDLNNKGKEKNATMYRVVNIKEIMDFLAEFKQIKKIEVYGYQRNPSIMSRGVGKVWMIFCKCWIGKRKRREGLDEIIAPKELKECIDM
jgi:SAM-dependent methyltransferase